MRLRPHRACSLPLVGLVLVFALYGCDPCAMAQEPSSNDATAAIKATAEAFSKVFADKDADALAEMWTSDGEYIDENGNRFAGRDAIKQEYKSFFEAYPDLTMTVSIDSIRLLSPTAAVEEGLTSVVPAPGGEPVTARYSAIHILQDGTWLLAYVRDSRIDAASMNGQLKDLEWLVGRWSSDHAGVTADVKCDWAAGKSYLKRDFEVKRDGQVISSSVEIIGWDPLQQQVASWTFSSEGGRSFGLWYQTAEGWLVQQSGVAADGSMTSAISWWAPLADGALGWSGAMRSIDGQPLADPRDVVLVRVAQESGN